ncbi:MAG: hypothetical protein ACLPN1_04825 [Dissulfurispiraceae bacterium]
MKILCITDQFEGSDHSSIEGIFGRYLREWCEVYMVYFVRDANSGRREGDKIYIPYRYKRHGLTKVLHKFIPLDNVDIVIVRNFFRVLKDILVSRKNFGYRVGFWHSFPHSYRRLFEAKKEKRAIFRKTIEHKLRTYSEKKLVSRCDFLLTMSKEFKDRFYADIDIRHLPLPMGVSFEVSSQLTYEANRVMKFLYTGTVDHLRETDVVVKAFSELEEDFEFDIFTRSDNSTTRYIQNLDNPKIRLYPTVPRSELFHKMAHYDVGVGLIADNSLYDVASPTKTIEYYSVGLPALVNYLPEYVSLFDNGSAFFCQFTKEDIKVAVRAALITPKDKLVEMGRKGRAIIKKQRDYKVLSEGLYRFLRAL